MASENGVKVILEYGNPDENYGMNSESFSNVASNAKSRTEFVAKLLALVEEYKFNGLSLRWDKPGCPHVRNTIFI